MDPPRHRVNVLSTHTPHSTHDICLGACHTAAATHASAQGAPRRQHRQRHPRRQCCHVTPPAAASRPTATPHHNNNLNTPAQLQSWQHGPAAARAGHPANLEWTMKPRPSLRVHTAQRLSTLAQAVFPVAVELPLLTLRHLRHHHCRRSTLTRPQRRSRRCPAQPRLVRSDGGPAPATVLAPADAVQHIKFAHQGSHSRGGSLRSTHSMRSTAGARRWRLQNHASLLQHAAPSRWYT